MFVIRIISCLLLGQIQLLAFPLRGEYKKRFLLLLGTFNALISVLSAPIQERHALIGAPKMDSAWVVFAIA